MPRAPRRLTAAATSLALALGGVALAAAPAHAAEYAPTSTWSVPTSVTWGETLSLDVAGVFTALPGANSLSSLSIGWWRVSDGALLSSDSFYVVGIDDVGTQIYGTISGVIGGGTYDGHTTTVYSNWTGAVAKKTFAQPALTASGTAVAGGTLSVGGSGWGATPTSYDWEWRRVNDNSIVASGSGSAAPGTYTVTSADVAAGSQFYAIVTAHLAGYADATWSTGFSQAAHLAPFADVTAVPTITGTGRLGTSFTASYDATGVTPAPESVTFDWHTEDGAIVGSGSAFTPTASLLGQIVYATATLHAADHADYTTLGSAFSATVALAEFTPGAAPVITGRNALGGTLTASVDTSAWVPVPTSFDYRWFLEDGTAIPDADDATLAVTAALVGEVVYVQATAHRADHASYVIGSAPTGRIAAPTLGASLGTVQAGDSLTIEAWGLLLGEEYTVELHSDPVVLGTAVSGLDGTISKSFTIPASTPAGEHTIVLLREGVQVAELSLAVTAATAPNPAPVIAATGADADLTAMALLTALTFLAAGAMLVISRRVTARRTATGSES